MAAQPGTIHRDTEVEVFEGGLSYYCRARAGDWGLLVHELLNLWKTWLSTNWHTVAAATAVIAPVTAAVVSILNTWRENRSLEISLLPEKSLRFLDSRKQYAFILRIANPAKSANSIKEWSLLISGTPEIDPPTDPPDLIKKSIPSGESINGLILVPTPYIFNSETIGFIFRPVRGRRTAFKFTKKELFSVVGFSQYATCKTYRDFEKLR